MDIDIPQTVGPAGTQPEGSRENLSNWQFYSLLVAAVLGVAYLLLLQGLEVFGFVTARLPLLLPLAVTVMSIVVRAPDIKTYEGVLKTSPDIAMGIISFDFWLLSARNETTGRVLVNAETMIRGQFVLAFLVLGLVTAVVSGQCEEHHCRGISDRFA